MPVIEIIRSLSSDCFYCNICFIVVACFFFFLFFYPSGMDPKIQRSNLPRECIRHFFPKRKCFVFDRPTNDKKLLANIEKVEEHQLDPQFQEQTQNFCYHIFTQARTKTLKKGILVTGKRESPFDILWGLIFV